MIERLDLVPPFSDPVLVFGVVMALMMIAPVLAERLRVPGLVGLILAGAIVGESGLGWLTRDATFRLLGMVGLLYLMFIAGLTLDLAQFSRLRARALGFGSVSFAIPAALAVGLGSWLLDFSMQQSLLLAAIVGSHTLLAFPVAGRLGITSNQAVIMAVGATMVTDVVSLVVLAGVLASLDGQTGVAFWASFGLGGIVYVAVLMLGVTRLGRAFFRTVQDRPDTTFAFLMTCLFLGAHLAKAAQLAPLIGAFLTGLAMNRLVPERSTLMTRLRFMGDALLVPFFLLSVGMLVDLRVLLDLQVWAYALLFSGMVIVGKAAAAHGVGAAFGHALAERHVIAGLTIPQAAATLAVTLEGFDRELFSADHVNAVVLMILITCFVGPWLVDRYGRAVALAQSTVRDQAAEGPRRILIPLANPQTVQSLTDFALLLNDPGAGQPLYPLTIARRSADGEADVAAAEKLLEQAVIYAAAADVPVNPLTRVDHNVAAGIGRAVEDQRITTVLIGWNGERSTRALVFGGILDQLLDETNEVLIVLRPGPPVQTTDRVLLMAPPLVDREPGFRETLDHVRQLVRQANAELHVYATADTLTEIQAALRTSPTPIEAQSFELAAWSDLQHRVTSGSVPSDLLVLWSSRKGSISWRSTLDRLPAQLTEAFRRNNVAIVYPSLPTMVELAHREGGAGDELRTAIRHARIRQLTTETNADDVLRRMAIEVTGRPNAPETEAVAQALAEREAHHRAEFMPGAILYTSHTSVVRETTIVLLWSAEGMELEGVASEVQLAVGLLVPADRAIDDFLAIVAAAAHRIRSTCSRERLRACDDEAAMRRVLQGDDEEPSAEPQPTDV